jgi:hypothetical protein
VCARGGLRGKPSKKRGFTYKKPQKKKGGWATNLIDGAFTDGQGALKHVPVKGLGFRVTSLTARLLMAREV